MAFAGVRVHTRRAGVDQNLHLTLDLRLLVGERAVFAGAAGKQNFRRALILRHRMHRAAGAAGAQNQHAFALEIHPVLVGQIQKAVVIGVVTVENAVPVHHRVHRADGFGPRLQPGAVGDDQLLVGDGHIDGPEGLFLQKFPCLLLGGQAAQLIAIAAQCLVDGLGVAVAQLCADQSVFHGASSSACHSGPQRWVSRSTRPKATAAVCTIAARWAMQGSWRP